MGATAYDDCLGELQALVRRGERDGLGVAQNLILRFVLSRDGAEARETALEGLLLDLAGGDHPTPGPAEERAFQAALIAMIERTKAVVGAG